MSQVVKKKLKIEGMHCSSCAINIDFELEDLNGVQKARTSYQKQETEIEYDEEQTDLKGIILAIQKTGYKAVLKDSD